LPCEQLCKANYGYRRTHNSRPNCSVSRLFKLYDSCANPLRNVSWSDEAKLDLLTQRSSATNTQPVPLYATPFCSDAAEYSSVCSCAGVKETTITVATSTAPEFSTYTFTTTVTSLIGGGSSGSSEESISASSSAASSSSTTVQDTTPSSSSSTTTTQDTASSTSSTTIQDTTAGGTTVGAGAGAGASTTSSTTSSTTTACPSGNAQCSGNTCTDLQTDEQNCGQCGTVVSP
jgi:hypothetical protein